jgi:hypothetical protein
MVFSEIPFFFRAFSKEDLSIVLLGKEGINLFCLRKVFITSLEDIKMASITLEEDCARIRKSYQIRVRRKSRNRSAPDRTRDYLKKSFVHTSFNGNGSFSLKYNGRKYPGVISDNHEKIKSRGTIPLLRGVVEISIDFPSRNKANAKLVEKIDSEFKLPWEEQAN